MYHLYHTPAFVLGSAPRGEGSKTLALFTRDLGMLSAAARSIREERSKLRSGLQDFSYSETTLVRGKEFWRVTNAALLENLYTTFRASPAVFQMFARVFGLLHRLLAGEEKNAQLFLLLAETVAYLKQEPIAPEKLSSVEIVLVLRILYALGYLASRGEFSVFLDDVLFWGDEVLARASALRALALRDINHSLRESQL